MRLLLLFLPFVFTLSITSADDQADDPEAYMDAVCIYKIAAHYNAIVLARWE